MILNETSLLFCPGLSSAVTFLYTFLYCGLTPRLQTPANSTLTG